MERMKINKRLLVLDCDFQYDTAKAIMGFYPGLEKVSRCKVFENEFPKSSDYTHGIITGSGVDVFDDCLWISRLQEYIREISGGGMYLLGICFGHEIIAKTFCGDVVKNEECELGIRSIDLTAEGKRDPLFHGISNLVFFEYHDFSVARIPPTARLLARNDFSIQAVRYTDRIYGVQFHPEVGGDLARKMCARHDRQFSYIQNEDIYDEERIRLMLNFINL